MTCPGFLCTWVGIASMRFSFTVMRSDKSNIVLANLSFDDDLILIVMVAGALAVRHWR